MTLPWKYLTQTGTGVYLLSHKLTPEVRAMLAAMASRAPLGGIVARYRQVVNAVAKSLADEEKAADPNVKTWGLVTAGPDMQAQLADELRWLSLAEERLCEYPLHPRVQQFFNDFVGNYGHSSIMELTGEPSIYTEGISWYDAYLLFDSPLCAGQEFSTRAISHKSWPMARSAAPNVNERFESLSVPGKTWILEELHNDWMEIFEAEVKWWTEHLTDPENRAALGIADKEPFRPALDRARWALPGSIATGCCHTGNLRERSRVIRDSSLLAQRSGAEEATAVWTDIRQGYAEALPGMAGMGLREAVYTPDSVIPAHLLVFEVPKGPEVEVNVYQTRKYLFVGTKPRTVGVRAYLDPNFNQIATVDVAFQCSLAVARDWHRHRTMYPWALNVVRDEEASIQIHSGYEPKSDLGREKLAVLLQKSTQAYLDFLSRDNQMQAMLCLPLGTLVQLRGQGGLRDVVYMLELRENAHGANFEYKAQAHEALRLLKSKLGSGDWDQDVLEMMGLQ